MYIIVYMEHNIYVFLRLTLMDNIYQGGVWACMGVHERARPCTPARPPHADFPLPQTESIVIGKSQKANQWP